MHPRIRMPLWAAVVLPAAAYAIRSAARGWDFVPDLPVDAIVFGALGLIIAATALARRAAGADEMGDELPRHVDDERDSGRGERQDDEVLGHIKR